MIYLEHPATYHPEQHGHHKYRNPHNPAPGVSGRGDAERRRHQLLTGLYGGGMMAGAGKTQKTVDVQKQQVEEVFKNLKSGLDLEEQEPRACSPPSLPSDFWLKLTCVSRFQLR